MKKSKLTLLSLSVLFCFSVEANEIVKWTSLTLQAVRINKTNPPIASRNLAMVEISMFDAVNSIVKKYQPYSMGVAAETELPKEVAVAQAAREILVKLYPTSTPYWDEQLSKTLELFPESSQKQKAIDLGVLIAENVWDLRRNDLKPKSLDVMAELGFEVGAWIPTPPAYAPALLPYWGKTKPFGILSGDQFRQDGPPKFFSDEYARDYLEIKEYGVKNNSSRSADQTQMALFWADGAGTVTPPGHWNQIALGIAKNKKLDLIETSRLMTLLNVAMADSAISAWDMKFFYNCWRPITAVQEADRDENNQTQTQLGWEPLLSTPPFPDYVSGHSTFSGAAATMLALYFETDKMQFVTSSEDLPGVIRSFSRFSEAADEAGKSRIYGGIHYEFANRDGKKAGKKVAEFVFTNVLLRK